MTLVACVAIVIAIVALICRARAFAERDEAVRVVWLCRAANTALVESNLEYHTEVRSLTQQRDDYRERWRAGLRRREPCEDGETMVATGPRLYGDERRERHHEED